MDPVGAVAGSSTTRDRRLRIALASLFAVLIVGFLAFLVIGNALGCAENDPKDGCLWQSGPSPEPIGNVLIGLAWFAPLAVLAGGALSTIRADARFLVWVSVLLGGPVGAYALALSLAVG